MGERNRRQMERFLLLLLPFTVYGGTIFDLPNFKGSVEIKKEGDIPKASEFFTKYAAGWGKPFIMKGAAKKITAFKEWSNDKAMAKRFPRAMFTQIEFAKKETRMAGAAAWPVTKFLEKYNTTDAYVVSNLDRYMAADVEIPELIKCGYATSYLDVNNFWFSSGNSDSVIHNDDQDNVNCVLSGTKRFFMVDPRHKNYVESEACGWTVASETGKGYGAYGGPPVIDSTNMDLQKFPRWKEVPWYDATVEAGDCLFIPTSWYHQVHTPKGRSQAFNIWWWRRDGPYSDSELKAWDECPHRDKRVTIGDCKFGYEGPPDPPATPFNPGRMTHCKGLEHVPPQTKDAYSSITNWQRFPERRLFHLLQTQEGVKDLFQHPNIVDLMTKVQTQTQAAQWGQQRPPASHPLKQDEDDDDGDEDL